MPDSITSANGRFRFVIQNDGNAVLYDAVGSALWSSGTVAPGSNAPGPPSSLEPPAPTPPPASLAPAAPLPAAPLPGAGRLIRVTDERDGQLLNRGYSYYSSAWVGPVTARVYVFAGHADGAPRFFLVDTASRAVERLGALVPYGGTGEGWYWDAEGWVYLCDGPFLRRVNPFTRQETIALDISEAHPGCRLWQAHSSDDGRTHSATVERIVPDGPYERLGTVVGRGRTSAFYPAQGRLDESQVTPDGGFVVIKEDDDNRVITLETGEARRLTNAEGALGHSDCGPGFMVGEDDQIGACVRIDLRRPFGPDNRLVLFRTWGMGHVAVRGGRCLLSDATHLALVDLDGAGVTPLIDHRMSGSGYDFQVHGNLDPTGRVACWVSNASGRFDVYLMVL